MALLPWDVLRLVLEYLSIPSRSSSADKESRSPGLHGLLTCALVNKEFATEVQALLFRTVDLSHYYKYNDALYWAYRSPNRIRLCSLVQTLHLPCVALQTRIVSLIGACQNLRTVHLQVSHVEKQDCLMECIQGALLQLKNLREVQLLQPSSIRALSIVYSLPFRLTKLHIVGLYGYTHSLWSNPYEHIDVEEVQFTKSKMAEDWDDHWFFSLCEHILVESPPTVLRIESGHCHLNSIPEATAQSLRILELRDAQQLLNLDHLERFTDLEQLGLSARHSFISLTSPLPQIKHLSVFKCNEVLVKLIIQWLNKGLFCNLETLTFKNGAFHAHGQAIPGQRLSNQLEVVVKERKLRCIPNYPCALYERSFIKTHTIEISRQAVVYSVVHALVPGFK